MADKARLLERLKKKPSIDVRIDPVLQTPVKLPGSPEKAPKKEKVVQMRACCASVKGQSSSHLATCEHGKPRPRKIVDTGLPGGRWPSGTKMEKAWDGMSWSCLVTLPDGVSFQSFSKGSFGSEKAVTKMYVDTLKKTEVQS